MTSPGFQPAGESLERLVDSALANITDPRLETWRRYDQARRGLELYLNWLSNGLDVIGEVVALDDD